VRALERARCDRCACGRRVRRGLLAGVQPKTRRHRPDPDPHEGSFGHAICRDPDVLREPNDDCLRERNAYGLRECNAHVCRQPVAHSGRKRLTERNTISGADRDEPPYAQPHPYADRHADTHRAADR
jgi:hypothetical protein